METIAAYLVVAMFKGLTNSYMTDEERAALDPDSREFYDRVWGCKIQLIGWVFYATILWLVKACLAVFYSRLTFVCPFPSASILNDISSLSPYTS